MHLNFEHYCQVVSEFQDADCDTLLIVRQMPVFFFLSTKFSTSTSSMIPLLLKSIELVPINQV